MKKLAIFNLVALLGVFGHCATPESAVDPIVESARGAKFLIVGDGALAAAISHRAAKTDPSLFVVPIRAQTRESIAVFRSRAAEVAPTKRVADAAELGPMAFMVAWLEDAPAGAMAAFALADAPAAPALAAGYDSIPSGAVWRIVKSGTVPGESDCTLFEGARDEIGETFAAIGSGDDALAAALRRHFSRLANDLGVRLAKGGAFKPAKEAFESAAAILPDSPSATLNLSSLEKKSAAPDPAARLALAKKLQGVKSDGAVLAVEGGVLLSPSDFWDAGWFWAASGLAAADADGAKAAIAALPSDAPREAITGLVRLSFSLQRGNCDADVAFLQKRVGEAGLTPELRLEAAEVVMKTSGDSVKAAALLERFALPGARGIPETRLVRGKPFWMLAAAATVRAFAAKSDATAIASLRAELQEALEQGSEEMALVVSSVFAPAQIELGNWTKAAEDFAESRDSSVAALAKAAGAVAAMRPQDAFAALDAAKGLDGDLAWAAHRIALEAAFRAGDRDKAAAAAKAVLSVRPRDAFSLWVLGSVAVQRGDDAGAVNLLQASVAAKPTLPALNDLASLLARIGNPAQAEKFARMALESAGAAAGGNLYDTLGETLYAQRRYAEAAAEFKKALDADSARSAVSNPVVNLHLAEALEKLGDALGAAKQIAIVDKNKDVLSVQERERLGAVRRAVASAIGGGEN